jgi:hypothetical protein
VRALEDIRNQVRSLTSRRYVDEAIAAYGASAFRSALMSTWIAVAADIIGKIRLLADEGEGVAVSLRDSLNNAIASNDVPALQRFETSLIKTAHEDLELIGRREADELTRLYKDRNLCAHPAFVAGGEDLFDPSPELVRAHLTAAVDALLSHPAVTGRKAIERFGREVASDSFPRDDQRLNDHLRAGYMDHSTKALRANLIKVICKETLKPDLDLCHRWRCTRAARELQKIAPSEFEEQLRSVLDSQQNGLTDAGLLTLVTGLCYVPGTWDLLHKGTQARVEELLQTVTPLDLVETHMLFHGPLPHTPVDQMLLLGPMKTPRDRRSSPWSATRHTAGTGCGGSQTDHRLAVERGPRQGRSSKAVAAVGESDDELWPQDTDGSGEPNAKGGSTGGLRAWWRPSP